MRGTGIACVVAFVGLVAASDARAGTPGVDGWADTPSLRPPGPSSRDVAFVVVEAVLANTAAFAIGCVGGLALVPTGDVVGPGCIFGLLVTEVLAPIALLPRFFSHLPMNDACSLPARMSVIRFLTTILAVALAFLPQGVFFSGLTALVALASIPAIEAVWSWQALAEATGTPPLRPRPATDRVDGF